MATSKNQATATLPKTTMIGLNHWNSTTKVSHCEFETQLVEPLTMKQGDSAQVRNVFLDASKINSEVIDLSEETELEMSFMIYAMMKKTNANLGNMKTDKLNISNGWISGTSFIAGSDDSNVDRIKNRYNLTNEELVDEPVQFVNPLHNYAELSMAGYWKGNYDNQIPPQAPGFVPNVLFDVTFSRWAVNQPFAQDLVPIYVNGGISPLLCRYNVDLNVPTNNKAINEPVYLFNPTNGKPYIRKVKIKIPAGVYAREELAVKITSLLAELKTQQQQINTENQNYEGNGELNDIYTAGVVDVNGNAHPPRHIVPFKSRIGSGSNPFQASIRFGYLSLTEKGTAEPFDYTNWTFSSNQAGQINADSPLDPAGLAREAIVDAVTLNPMTNDLVGFCDESGLFPTLEEKKAHKNPQVCWSPLCNNFRIQDHTYGGAPSGGQYEYSQLTSNANALPVDSIATGFYDTRKAPETTDYGGLSLETDTRTNSYNCGQQNLMMFHHWIFSPAVSPKNDVVDNLVGGTFGTSEIAITYNDNNSNKFAFNFLHTPIEKAVDENSGSVPVVVRQVSSLCQNLRSDLDATQSNQSLESGSNYRTTSYADRHSGILFTELKATQNGKAFDFWEGILGFDLKDIIVTPPSGVFYNKWNGSRGERLTPNPTLLTYEEFLNKSTGSLYGISFQQNQQLLSANLGNELINAPDFYGEGLPTIVYNDTIIESQQASTLVARNLPASLLSDLGGSILCEITGYANGSDLQSGKDLLAVKSIVSLYYLSDNSYISSDIDSYVYYHTSSVSHTISKLKVRFLNPITQKVIPNTVLGNKNSLFLAITQQVQLFA